MQVCFCSRARTLSPRLFLNLCTGLSWIYANSGQYPLCQQLEMFSSTCPESSLSLPRPLLSLLRIYVANLLQADHQISQFTRDSIDSICIYLFRMVAELVLGMKELVGSQGRTIPNFLHLLLVCERAGWGLQGFMHYLRVNKDRLSADVASRFETKRLLDSQEAEMFFAEEPEHIHKNILTIPAVYTAMSDLSSHALPIRQPVADFLQKPPPYTFLSLEVNVDKTYDNERAAREAVYSETQMRRSLGGLHKGRIMSDGLVELKKTDQNFIPNRTPKFDLIKFL